MLFDKRGLVLLLALMSPMWVCADSVEGAFEQEYVLSTWDSDSGSPFIAVTSLAQTQDGYLWIGSYAGLARFDGLQFLSGPNPEIPVGDVLVLSMVVDDKGILWVGTSKGIYSRENGEWTHFYPQDGSLNGLVYSMACDSRGELVALVGRKVVRWNGSGFAEMPSLPTTIPTLSQTTCFFDNENRLWITGRRFLYYYQDGVWHALRHVLESNKAERLYGAGPARGGGIWWAEETTLKKWMDGKVVHTKARIEGHQFDEVSLWEDDAGNLWEAGERNGVIIHGVDGRHLICTVDEGLTNNVIISVSHDDEGNVWLGSDGGGLARIRPRSLIAHDDRDGLPQPVVNTLFEQSPNRLLVATHGGGVLPFEEGRFGPAMRLSDRRELDDQSWVQALAISPEGGLWVGTYQTGLFYTKGDEQIFWGFADLGGRHVFALHLDSDERLWVGTENGVARIVGRDVTSYGGLGIDWGVVNMLAEDRESRIWVANKEGVLWQEEGESFRRVDSLGGYEVGRVGYLYTDERGELWITNLEGDILRKRQEGWVRYSSSSGLPAGVWKPVASDNEGYMWFGSERGVMRVSLGSLDAVTRDGRGELQCQILNRIDGMKTATCRADFQKIGLRTEDGRIWFATIRGLVEVDPGGLRITPQKPQVHIEQVRTGSRLLKSPILPDDVVVVPPGTKRVNIHYGGTSLSYGEYTNFAYRLEGVDADWVEAGLERVARLPDIRPGEYAFQVRALDMEGRVGDEASVMLIVEPFWWQMWWVKFTAVALFVLTVIAGVMLVSRWRYRQRTERLEQARELGEERLRSAQVKQEMEAATAANRAKSEFLATMSHEIRTPLNGVIGSTDLLLETSLTGEQHEHMTTLRASAETLLAVLNDILDFSKIEAGGISIEEAQFDLSLILREVIEVVVPRAISKGVELALVIPPTLPLLVVGDSARLRQVLINLVGNAVKFTEKGSVTVKVELVDSEPELSRKLIKMHFSVRDTGVGIDPAGQTKLFDRFTQADASTTRKYGGTGLGLAICKRLVELMGGQINVRSAPGKGAEFYFELPFAAQQLAVAPGVSHEGLVVVLEDVAPVLEAEVSFLERHEIRTQGTLYPAEALRWLEEAIDAPNESLPVLFLDESCAEVLTDDQKRWLDTAVEQGELGIILMSPRPNHERTDSWASIHMTLRKPLLDAAILRDALSTEEAVSKTEEPSSSSSEENAAPSLGIRVLLADDDAVNRLVIGKQLEHLGCAIDCAENGSEAVALARLHPYDIIFMDCRMPVMDGYTATNEIRRSLPDAPPVIAITANTAEEDRDHCAKVGMVDFVSKPVRRGELSRVLKRWVRKTETDSTSSS